FRNAVEHGSTGNQTTSGDAVEHGSTGNRTASGDAVEHGSTGRRDAPGDASADGASKDAADDLTVRVGPTETGFYVADDGPGIPVDERDTVFEHGHTTSESGTGFGLSIVESIVEAHGWDIEVTAPEPDLGGARFEFDIGGVRSEVEPRFSLSDD
ncbi:PAS domain-containing protein, partial [Haloferax gibbonsii ATCC 33959]